jgi:hypothetical protein
MMQESNSWKTAMLAIAIGVPLVAFGAVVANLVDRSRESNGGASPTASSRAPAAVVEQCNQYAAQAERDATRVLRDGVLGGAVGAGIGAAGGAIADGGDGAGKGAGIGALVGATAGTFYGLNEENRKSEQAMAAYRDCMARRGY